MRRGARVGVVSYARDRDNAPTLQESCELLGEQRGSMRQVAASILAVAARGVALRRTATVISVIRPRAVWGRGCGAWCGD